MSRRHLVAPGPVRTTTGAIAIIAIALTLMLTACGPAAAQSDVLFLQVVWDNVNEWYRWEYRIYVDPGHGANNENKLSYTITGIEGLLAAGMEGTPQHWAPSLTGDSVTWTYTCNCSRLDPRIAPTPPDYLWYASSVGTSATLDWVRTWEGMLEQEGTTTGAGTSTDFAWVTAWDNHLSYGQLAPAEGSYTSPAPVIADETAASAWPPTAAVPGAGNYDIAGFRVETTRRLALSVNMNGHLQRVDAEGASFAGNDTRKAVSGPYELSSQWKVSFHGAYLDLAENPLVSPTSLTPTDFDTWTWWAVGLNDVAHDSGWLWPSTQDAWSGNAVVGTSLPEMDIYVERNQYEGGPNEAAEMWIAGRVLRRGLQDTAGNYRQVITILLTVAE